MIRPCGQDGRDRLVKRVYVGECGGSRSVVGRARDGLSV